MYVKWLECNFFLPRDTRKFMSWDEVVTPRVGFSVVPFFYFIFFLFLEPLRHRRTSARKPVWLVAHTTIYCSGKQETSLFLVIFLLFLKVDSKFCSPQKSEISKWLGNSYFNLPLYILIPVTVLKTKNISSVILFNYKKKNGCWNVDV